ncbi:MAG TPA: hypothetical protein VF735_15130 [Pyrinomonadaceae bacterium]
MTEKKAKPLRDDFRPALIDKLTDVLTRTKINNNLFIEYKTFNELADLDLQLAKKPIGKLSKDYVTDSPLVDFLFEVLAEEIHGSRKYDSQVEPILLTEIEKYKDPHSLADRLVKDFESLPREYKLYIKLPIFFFKEILGTERFELSSALSLVYPSEEFKSSFPPPIYEPRRRRSFSLFSFAKETEQRLDWDYRVYCEVSIQGFIGIYEDTSPIKRCSFLVRAFCGLSLALQLFETDFTFLAEDAYLKIYEKNENKWNAKKTRVLPTEFAQGLDKLRLQESFIPKEIINKRPQFILSVLKKLFSNEQENERILRAAQWYFDSYCGDNELLSFVKSTICLEILLGDKKVSDLIGIMELLRNRCAYLIGSNQIEREQILKDFNEIYRTRSEIVHNGQNRLTKLERESLFKLRQLCARVIRKETQLAT